MLALQESILAQHSALSSLIADIRGAHARGASWEDLARRFDDVITAVSEHFDSEERDMAQASYPLLGEHRTNHETFLRRLRVLRAECDRRETELMAVFMDMLETWLRNHERTADGLLLEYLGRHR